MFEIVIIFSAVFCLLLYAIYVHNFSLQLGQAVQEKKNNLQAYEERAKKIFKGIIQQLEEGGIYEKNLLLDLIKTREGSELNIDSAKSTIFRAIARAEDYPTINSVSMRKEFQNQIAEVEEKIQIFIEAYNYSANEYNSFIMSFPASIICSAFGRIKAEYINSIS